MLISPNPTIATPPADLAQQANLVATYLEGTLSTARRAAENPKVANVTMTTCRITVTPQPSANAIYLYQEQAIADRPDQPYRQRILEISPSPTSQTVRSRSFKLAQPQQWVSFCGRSDLRLQAQDFPEVVCSVFLKATATGFRGATEATGCPGKVRGAVVIRNRIWLHERGMETWDRGFDAAGKQVWGAGEEAYQFLRP